ncbi:hypothetical protein BY996DRAFT_6410723 [Phakopsora pachyrhizi]|nr:hypothetical protein BY996DRAFT_6410723 [Phakopsora pachyrhizi]
MLVDFNTSVGHFPKNRHEIVYIMQHISNPSIAQKMIWVNLLFESLHLVTRDIIASVNFVPQQVTTENPLSFECALAGFLVSCFSFNKNRGAIISMKGCKVNDNTIKDPSAGTFKNCDDMLLMWFSHMQSVKKFHQPPPHPLVEKGKVKPQAPALILFQQKLFSLFTKRGLMVVSNNWRKCGALESLQIITLSNEILILKGKDFKEPYWPRTVITFLRLLKVAFFLLTPNPIYLCALHLMKLQSALS